MNLGAFAGGAAQGIMNEQHLELQRRQQENADKAAKMAEEEHASKMDDIAQSKLARDKMDALHKSAYGPQEVESTVMQDDGAGNQTPIAVKKTVTRNYGDDLAYDARVAAQKLAIMMQHNRNFNPMDAIAAAKMVRDAQDSEDGSNLIKGIYGDAAAFEKAGQRWGFDPKAAKLARDPKTGGYTINGSDGRSIDVTHVLAGLGSGHYLQNMQAAQQISQGAESHNLGMRTGEYNLSDVMPTHLQQMKSASNLANQQANVLIPSQAAKNIASAEAAGEGARTSKILSAAGRLGYTTVNENGQKVPDSAVISTVAGLANSQFGHIKNGEQAMTNAAGLFEDRRSKAAASVQAAASSKDPKVMADYKAKLSRYGSQEALVRAVTMSGIRNEFGPMYAPQQAQTQNLSGALSDD